MAAGMSDGDTREAPGLNLGVALILTGVVVGGLIDLVLDAPDGVRTGHLVFELSLIVLSLGALIYLARGWLRTRASLEATRRDLVQRQAERDTWRSNARKALEGLGQEVDRQFTAWALTPAERDAALWLLKGASIKRIARETSRSERTVRQHAVAVYRKSGLSGRAELAGFFLGDLPLPAGPRPPGGDRPTPTALESGPHP